MTNSKLAMVSSANHYTPAHWTTANDLPPIKVGRWGGVEITKSFKKEDYAAWVYVGQASQRSSAMNAFTYSDPIDYVHYYYSSYKTSYSTPGMDLLWKIPWAPEENDPQFEIQHIHMAVPLTLYGTHVKERHQPKDLKESFAIR